MPQCVGHQILKSLRLGRPGVNVIACPTCGRIQVDLFTLVQEVRQTLANDIELPIKVAVMGCIVNGPGEMADADFGYVGSGPGRVNLYVGQELVVRNVPEAEAPERLLAVIDERRGDA